MSNFKLPPTSDFLVRWFPLAALCAVIAHYFWFVNSHAINIPYEDDIYDFLQIVSMVENAGSARDAFPVLANQYNDHRTSASRLVVFGVYLVEGELNFHTLTLVANLGLLLILLVFYLTVRKEKYRWVYLLVAALLLLNFRYFKIILFSQAAFAYYYVCLYAFACIFTLHKVSGPRFLLAAVFCTLSSLALASGHIVWLMGLVSLLHQCLVSGHRSLMWPAMWLLFAAVILTLWYADFTQGIYRITSELIANNRDNSPAIASEILSRALVDPTIKQVLTQYGAFFLVILGSAPIYFSTLGAGTAGFAILAVLLFVTLKCYKHDDIRLALYCWFLVAFAAAATVGRALLTTPEYVLTQRYSFISALLVCTLALLMQVRFALVRTPAVLLVLLLAVTYWSWSNFHFKPLFQDHMNQRHSIFNNGHFPVVLTPVGESDVIVNRAISDGIYNPPCRPFPECEGLSSLGD